MPPGEGAAAPRTVLHAVRELHLRGFERLRIAPTVAPTGLSWRCAITDRDSTMVEHGARLCSRLGGYSAWHTSGWGSNYFNWGELPDSTTARLADEIERRLPELMEAARGPDAPYVAWFEAMLEATEPHYLPYARADFDVPDDHLPATAPWANLPPLQLPLPPPGGCRG